MCIAINFYFILHAASGVKLSIMKIHYYIIAFIIA